MRTRDTGAALNAYRLDRASLGIAFISAGSLTFEVGLTRLFAIQQFHHFAFVVVSLAVMGIAASGLALSLRRKPTPLLMLSGAFTLAIGISYLTIDFLPFDSYSIAWDVDQIWILLLYFSVAIAPFLFAGWAVSACMDAAGPNAYKPYAANLAGAAFGVPLALISISQFGEESSIILAIALGLLASMAFTPRKIIRIALALLTILVLFELEPPDALKLRLSPYKPLSIALHAPDAKVTISESNASARVDIVESASIHVLPGLSLNAPISPPLQAGMFIDGDGPIPISALPPDSEQAKEIAAFMPPALVYQLRPNAHVLILTPGAGLDLAVSIAAGSQVTTTIEDPLVQFVLSDPYASFNGHLFSHPNLTVLSGTGRSLLRQLDDEFDVIYYALSQGFRPVTSGAFSLSENYDLTIEAFRDAYRHLNDDGLLAITRWLGTPPSESARAWSTLLAALKLEDAGDLPDRLLAYRGMRTATLVAARRPFATQELEFIRDHLNANGFDPIYLPDLETWELNRHNRLPQDLYHQLYADLLAKPSTTMDEYDFNLNPPSDDQPFFYHFFRWRQTPEVLAALGLTWQPFGGSGYLVLVALLMLMLIMAAPLIILPVWINKKRNRQMRPRAKGLIYFACLGAGYLLIEIPLIQRLALPLERPVYALATTLFTLLLASGLGSLLSPHMNLRRTLFLLIILLSLTNILLPRAIHISLSWPLPLRVILFVVALIPTGLLMGVPFASGLRKLDDSSPGSIPWAWAINGAISGVSGVAAALIALDVGFSATFYVGILAYFGAWLTTSGLTGDPGGKPRENKAEVIGTNATAKNVHPS